MAPSNQRVLDTPDVTDEDDDRLPVLEQVTKRHPDSVLCNDRERSRLLNLILREHRVLVECHHRRPLSSVLASPSSTRWSRPWLDLRFRHAMRTVHSASWICWCAIRVGECRRRSVRQRERRRLDRSRVWRRRGALDAHARTLVVLFGGRSPMVAFALLVLYRRWLRRSCAILHVPVAMGIVRRRWRQWRWRATSELLRNRDRRLHRRRLSTEWRRGLSAG